jgi:trimeric autotransporter adhesin
MTVKRLRGLRAALGSLGVLVFLVFGAGVASAIDYQGGVESSNACEGEKFSYSAGESTGNQAGCAEWGNHVSGPYNTAFGPGMMPSLKAGQGNVAIGFDALGANSGGSYNLAVGPFALGSVNASYNEAFGWRALSSTTTGAGNIASGYKALTSNKTGSDNDAIGSEALASNISGSANLAFGTYALRNDTGSSNIAIGALAGRNLTTGTHNIDIDNEGVAGEEGTTRIGGEGPTKKTYVAGVYKKPVGASACAVQVSSEGQLGCNSEGASGAVATFLSTKEVPSGNCLAYTGTAKIGNGACSLKTTGFSTSPRLAPMPANGGAIADLYADTTANVTGTDTATVTVIDSTTGATVLSCTVTSSTSKSCSNTSETVSVAPGHNVEVAITAAGESGNKKAWRVTFRM